MALFGDSKRIGVVAQANAKSGQGDHVRKTLVSLAGTSRKEPGCLRYDVFEDKHHEGIFFTSEEWESEDALERHMELNKSALNDLKAMLRGEPAIHVLKQVA
jgi:quinol monooxygenase YgiN